MFQLFSDQTADTHIHVCTAKFPNRRSLRHFLFWKNPVFGQDKIFRFFSKKTGKQERLEFYPWPETALREALTNSLAHQDYTSPIQTTVNIYPKRIVFITPGRHSAGNNS